MELIYFKSEAELNSWVLDLAQTDPPRSGAEFLQSWQWGEILRADGAEILRMGVSEAGKILAAVTLVKKKLPAGRSYWLAPRGPLFAPVTPEKQSEALKLLAAAVKKLDSRAIFWRTELARERTAREILLGGLPYKKTINLEPAQTLLLDLEPSPAELLAAMQPKTRYNIRLAVKKGVTVRTGTAADFSEFWRLMKLTGARDNFRVHTDRHYQELLNFDPKFIKLYLAEYQGCAIAAALFCCWGDKVTYLHGASDDAVRNVMAPHLLQWTAITDAQAAGYSYYDFYGIDDQKWPGVTRFKLGFGGRRISYAGTYDLIWNPGFYKLYSWARRLRRLG
jgi:lipid II:glycine glycyltransferase (peptidoglycan interpeptide bridge formation enzyme)